jgi:hypothetical protein
VLHSSTGAEGISSLDNGTRESLSTLWSTLAKFFVFRLDNVDRLSDLALFGCC